MPERIFYDKKAGVIKVDSYGKITKETIMTSLKKVKEIEREIGTKNVLVDTRKETTFPDITEIYELGDHFPVVTKFAILVSSKQATEEGIKFIETIARNKGVSMQIFKSEEKALEWLKSK